MNSTMNQTLAAAVLTFTSLSVEAAGFQLITVDDPDHAALTVGVWYPSDTAVPAEPNTEFGLAVAKDAAIAQSNGALIVISHGFGGWYAGHADTAADLADAGFIVAAPTHNGNTWSDMSSPIEQWMLDRPRHVSRVIDGLLDNANFAPVIEPDKIGVYGFSAGGYTALGLIGGVPDFERIQQHCEKDPQEFACAEGMMDSMLTANMQALPESAWGADTRVQAAAIAAPGFGFAYTADTLANITANVQLWSGELDESVPTDSNAAWIAEQLPVVPETHWVDKANHFAFMTVTCREAFRLDDPEEYEVICGDAEGFDRFAFHTDMHKQMIRFFRSSLRVGG